MSDDNGGCLAILLVIVQIAIAIGAGILAWNWIEPDSFGRVLLFLAAWGILGWIGYIIAGGIFAALGGLD
ncbi:hypothetical protein [Butyricimonas faecihominis]|jgi:hypothetical protein